MYHDRGFYKPTAGSQSAVEEPARCLFLRGCECVCVPSVRLSLSPSPSLPLFSLALSVSSPFSLHSCSIYLSIYLSIFLSICRSIYVSLSPLSLLLLHPTGIRPSSESRPTSKAGLAAPMSARVSLKIPVEVRAQLTV